MAPPLQHMIDQPFLAGSTAAPLPHGRPQTAAEHVQAAIETSRADEESRLQTCWNEEMEKEMGIPQGYRNVAVLLIRWCDELDDELKCGDEVRELEALFRREDGFNYNTTILELHNQTNPQHQLNSALSKFVEQYDGPHNLLIVYYSGHGVHHEPVGSDKFAFHASNSVPPPMKYTRPYPAVVSWNKIEQTLMDDVESNVFAILDTCFAGNLLKGGPTEETRIFEILSATGPNQVTSGPGKRSFTRALIQSLEKLLAKCGDTGRQFNSWELLNTIIAGTHRRNNPPFLFPAGVRQFNRHLALAPLRNTDHEREDKFQKLDAKSFLTLRFSLQDKRLTEDNVRDLVKGLSRAAKESKVKVQSIDWLALRYSSKLRSRIMYIRAMVRWRTAIQAVRAMNSPLPRRSSLADIVQKRQNTDTESDVLLTPGVKRPRLDEVEDEDDDARRSARLLTPSGTASEMSGHED